MATRLEAALDYAGQGRSVIPVEPNSKIPAVRWGRFQVERATERQIRSWWNFADFNIGVVCGRISNLVALDVDLRAGGNASLARLEAAHRPVGGLEVATPGGLHRWFAHPGGRIPNSTSTLGAGLDVRADGGMIVVPPSERPDGAYRFGRLFDADVPPLPDWLAALLSTSRSRGPRRGGQREGRRPATWTRRSGACSPICGRPRRVTATTCCSSPSAGSWSWARPQPSQRPSRSPARSGWAATRSTRRWRRPSAGLALALTATLMYPRARLSA